MFVTLLLHLALIKVVPASGFFSAGNVHPVSTDKVRKPMRVQVAPKDRPVPANLLPPQMRPPVPKLVEVNPLAPVAAPDHDRNTGAAEQRAAQPEPTPDKAERAKVKGELPDSTRIINAIPRELLDKSLRPEPGQPVGVAPPAKSKPAAPAKPADGAKREEGPAAAPVRPVGKPLLEKGRAFADKTGEVKSPDTGAADKKPETPTPQKKDGAKNAEGKKGAGKTPKTESVADTTRDRQDGPDAPPRPRPKATMAGTTGPLGNSIFGASERGMISADSKFSKMGEYSSRMFEIIQAAWWVGVDRSRIAEQGTVVIKFTLHKDGSVTDAHIEEKTTSDRAAYLCLDSITGRAPFDEWPEDMVGLIGDKQEGTLTFHYR